MLVVVIAAILGGRTAGAVAAVAATLSLFHFFLASAVSVDAPRQCRRRRDHGDPVGRRLAGRGEVAARLVLFTSGPERSAAAIGRGPGASSCRGDRDRERADGSGAGRDDRTQAAPPPARLLARAPALSLGAAPARAWRHARHPPARAGRAAASASPEDGVELAVSQGNRQIARLVLIGDPTVDVTLEERVVVVVWLDQLASAFREALRSGRLQALHPSAPRRHSGVAATSTLERDIMRRGLGLEAAARRAAARHDADGRAAHLEDDRGRRSSRRNACRRRRTRPRRSFSSSRSACRASRSGWTR